MGRKRSHSNTDEEKIRKKIRKLQEQLNKKPRRRRVFIESSSSEDECHQVETVDDAPMGDFFPENEPTATEDTNAAADQTYTTTAAATTVAPELSDHDILPTEKELDNDILKLLGDAPKAEIALGPAIHKDVATRWQEILKTGLQKEIKEKLLNDYAIPSNCELLLAPELNAEVKAALPDLSIKKDSALYTKQKQIGSALAALALSMDRLLKDGSKQSIIKSLSDACRILCDSHFGETRIRRNFVVSAVNPSLKDALINAPRDKFLFGDNFTDKVKAAQTIQKSGEALKAPAPQKTPFAKNNFAKKNNLNAQHRKSYSRGSTQAARGSSSQRPFTRNSARQQQDRAPPAPRRDRSPPPRRAPPARR